MLDTQKVKDIIRHRHPFLLVDKVIELEEGKRAIGIKNVSINEHFFNGHFPDHPVMPGVLVVEALAQVSAIVMLSKDENKGNIGLLAGIDKCRFKKQVKPGDQLRLEVEIMRVKVLLAREKELLPLMGN